jgi:hypothetical protein
LPAAEPPLSKPQRWYRLERCMGLTHAEFLRTLPTAAPGMSIQADKGCIRLSDPPRLVLVELGPETRRTLGSLVLPETSVRLSFEGFSAEQREVFLRRFDLAYRRGGG